MSLCIVGIACLAALAAAPPARIGDEVKKEGLQGTWEVKEVVADSVALLAPEQVRVMTVSERFREYAAQVEKTLKDGGFRSQGDYRPDKIGAKVREAQLEKVPYMLVIGEKEQTAGTVAVPES